MPWALPGCVRVRVLMLVCGVSPGDHVSSRSRSETDEIGCEEVECGGARSAQSLPSAIFSRHFRRNLPEGVAEAKKKSL
eukprot:4521130-Prymnesium_polylepis.1